MADGSVDLLPAGGDHPNSPKFITKPFRCDGVYCCSVASPCWVTHDIFCNVALCCRKHDCAKYKITRFSLFYCYTWNRTKPCTYIVLAPNPKKTAEKCHFGPEVFSIRFQFSSTLSNSDSGLINYCENNILVSVL